MVAHLRKHRYRKFERRRKAGARTEEPAVGISGMESRKCPIECTVSK